MCTGFVPAHPASCCAAFPVAFHCIHAVAFALSCAVTRKTPVSCIFVSAGMRARVQYQRVSVCVGCAIFIAHQSLPSHFFFWESTHSVQALSLAFRTSVRHPAIPCQAVAQSKEKTASEESKEVGRNLATYVSVANATTFFAAVLILCVSHWSVRWHTKLLRVLLWKQRNGIRLLVSKVSSRISRF